MNRRRFLRTALAAAVGAAIVPRVPLVAPAVKPAAVAAGAGVYSYKILARCYTQMRNPELRPHIMICSRKTYDWLVARLEQDAIENGTVS